MDGQSDANLVGEALHALFSSQDGAERRKANEWLQEYQASPRAWTTSIELLKSSCSDEQRFFSAQTLHAKAMRVEEEQLSVEDQTVLQSELVKLMRLYAEV